MEKLLFRPIMLADIVKLLVTNGAQAGTETAESKETPLHLSSANGHLGVVRERNTLTHFKRRPITIGQTYRNSITLHFHQCQECPGSCPK